MFENPFQAALVTIFILLACTGVAVFAMNPDLFGSSSGPSSASAQIWGTINEDDISATLVGAGVRDNETLSIDYTHVDPRNLRSRLVNKLAKDEGPDALLIPHTQLLQLKEFLVTFGPQMYNRRSFRSNFVEGTEVFTDQEGVIALPFAMDPLVMYWNRDMISEAGFVSPPETWSDVQSYVDKITNVDETQNINKAAIALGTANNIEQTKAILSALFYQAGNPVSEIDRNSYQSVLSDDDRTEAAVRLYTQYANPSASTYTWNNTFTSDRQSFIANELGMYFDTGQAVSSIRSQNPNLNFDVTQIPQRENGQPRTYADMYGVAMLKQVNSRRRGSVFRAMQSLVSRPFAESLLENTNLTPVRKSVVAQASSDSPQKQTYLNVAPTARGWIEPDPAQTNQIFADLITNVTSGQSSVSEALNNADDRLQLLFNDSE